MAIAWRNNPAPVLKINGGKKVAKANPKKRGSHSTARRTTKTATKKRTTPKRGVKRRNGVATAAAKTVNGRRRGGVRRRNGSDISNLVQTAFISSVVLTLIDLVIGRFALPQSGYMRTLIKFGLAWGVHTFGTKLKLSQGTSNVVATVIAVQEGVELLTPLIGQLTNGVLNALPGVNSTSAGALPASNGAPAMVQDYRAYQYS